MDTIETHEKIPKLAHYPLIVAGGGVAGIAAALAARRAGIRVLLIEKSVKLGGLATLGLINYFVPMCNGRGRQIIFGMAEEFFRLSIRYGYDSLPDAWQEGKQATRKTALRYCTRYDPDIFSLALTELLHREGVEILYDSIVVRTVMEGTHCSGVVTENKSGRGFYEADMVVDTTGDADLLRRSGVPVAERGNYYIMVGKQITLENCRKAVETADIRNAISAVSGGRVNLYGTNQPPQIPLFYGTRAEDVNQMLLLNQLELFEKLKKDDRKGRSVVTLPGMPQFRTVCRIEGDYILQESDVFRHFEDSIGAINDFDHRDALYEIPYRTLVRSGFDNLITAGRSAAGEGYAWDVIRVIPPAIITGQAAGNAAALALETKRAITQVDLAELQRRLTEQRVMIHFDDSLVPDGSWNRRDHCAGDEI